jgi:hypothetical protein
MCHARCPAALACRAARACLQVPELAAARACAARAAGPLLCVAQPAAALWPAWQQRQRHRWRRATAVAAACAALGGVDGRHGRGWGRHGREHGKLRGAWRASGSTGSAITQQRQQGRQRQPGRSHHSPRARAAPAPACCGRRCTDSAGSSTRSTHRGCCEGCWRVSRQRRRRRRRQRCCAVDGACGHAAAARWHGQHRQWRGWHVEGCGFGRSGCDGESMTAAHRSNARVTHQSHS